MQDQRFVAPTIFAFAVIGAIGGLLSFGVFGFAPGSVVITTPILCALIGVVAAPRRLWWLFTSALVPIAGALNGLMTALVLFSRPDFGLEWDYAGLTGIIVSLPFLPALLLAGWMTRGLLIARPKSLVAGIYARRFPWTIAFIATNAAAMLTIRGYYMGAPLTALMSAAALAVMGFVGVRSLMAFLRVGEAMRLAAFLRPSHNEVGVQRDDAYLDLGLGDAQYVYVDPATLLRGAPTAKLLLEGDPVRSQRIARNALLLSVFGSLLALAVFIAAAERALHYYR